MTRPYEPIRSLVRCEAPRCPRSDPHLVGQTRCSAVTVWTDEQGWRSADRPDPTRVLGGVSTADAAERITRHAKAYGRSQCQPWVAGPMHGPPPPSPSMMLHAQLIAITDVILAPFVRIVDWLAHYLEGFRRES